MNLGKNYLIESILYTLQAYTKSQIFPSDKISWKLWTNQPFLEFSIFIITDQFDLF